MNFGIIKERKNPPDRRVVLSPAACQIVLDSYEDAQITVEPSDIRVFSNMEKTIIAKNNRTKFERWVFIVSFHAAKWPNDLQ